MGENSILSKAGSLVRSDAQVTGSIVRSFESRQDGGIMAGLLGRDEKSAIALAMLSPLSLCNGPVLGLILLP